MALKNNRSIHSNKPLFSELDEDDAMTSAFMNSSSATYLAADRLPSAYGSSSQSPEERQRMDLLQQIRQVEQKTLDSSKRSQKLLIESEQIGVETAEDLCRQREQLSNTENRLDDINATLKDTQKNINGIKSVFSSLKQWWATPKKPAKEDKENTTSPSSLASSEQKQPALSKNLSSAVENSQLSLQFSRESSHPALRLRGLDEDEGENLPVSVSEFRAYTNKVDEQLEQDLEAMSSGLSRLKDFAQGLGNEIEEHNAMLDRIQAKAEKADSNISHQNTQMKHLLKR